MRESLRRRFGNLPIRRKLALVTLGVSGLAMLLAGTALITFEFLQLRRSFVTQLRTLGLVVGRNLSAPLAFADRRGAVEVLEGLERLSLVSAGWVVDSEDRIFARVGEEETIDVGHIRAETPGEVIFTNGVASLSIPIVDGATVLGTLHLHAPYRERQWRMLTVYGVVVLLVLVGSLGVIVFMAPMMHRWVANPLVSLATAARAVGEREDYTIRVREGGEDEVGQLTRVFNRMLEQIQSRDGRLRESQERYRVAVEGANDGLWDWDLRTDEIYLSPRWKEMLGYSDSELANHVSTAQSLIHADDLDRVIRTHTAYVEGRLESYSIEFRMRHRDGGYRWVHSRGAVIRDEQGQPTRFAGSHTDITHRVLGEEELRASRQRFESLVNSIYGVVRESEPETFRTLFVSARVESILGYTPRFLLENPDFWLHSIDPADRLGVQAAFERGIAEDRPFQVEYQILAEDGRQVWLRESVSVEREGETRVRLLSVALDITAQKVAAQQLARMQGELLQASRIAGMAEVATGVLHNVGNVLNSVNVSAALLVDRLRAPQASKLDRLAGVLREHENDLADFLQKGGKGRQVVEYLEALARQTREERTALFQEACSLRGNVEHINQIVAMQQSYAKVGGAREALALEPIVEDALRMVADSLRNHGIEVVRHFGVVPPVWVDRHRVLQIVVNLLNNARHALAERAADRRITLSVADHGSGRVRLEVIDNGVGIVRENLTRIFQHGFTTRRDGHGFGLHSGANAAKELGGRLTAQSDGPGQGATFVLELPTEDGAGGSAGTVASTGSVQAVGACN